MLPQPRNGVTATTRSLIPNVLTKKPAPTPTVKTDSLPTQLKKPKINPTPLINDYSDDSDNDEVQNDFFSIHKPVEIPDVDMPLDIEQNVNTKAANTHKPKGIESFFKKEEVNHVQLEPDYDSSSIADQSEAGSSYNGYFESENSNSNEVALDEEAVSTVLFV